MALGCRTQNAGSSGDTFLTKVVPDEPGLGVEEGKLGAWKVELVLVSCWAIEELVGVLVTCWITDFFGVSGAADALPSWMSAWILIHLAKLSNDTAPLA